VTLISFPIAGLLPVFPAQTSSPASYRGSDCDVGLDFDRAAAYNRESHPRNNGTMVGRQTLTIPICIRLCSMPKIGLMCNPHRRIDIKQEWDANNCSNTCESANGEKLDEDDLESHAGLGASKN